MEATSVGTDTVAVPIDEKGQETPQIMKEDKMILRQESVSDLVTEPEPEEEFKSEVLSFVSTNADLLWPEEGSSTAREDIHEGGKSEDIDYRSPRFEIGSIPSSLSSSSSSSSSDDSGSDSSSSISASDLDSLGEQAEMSAEQAAKEIQSQCHAQSPRDVEQTPSFCPSLTSYWDLEPIKEEEEEESAQSAVSSICCVDCSGLEKDDADAEMHLKAAAVLMLQRAERSRQARSAYYRCRRATLTLQAWRRGTQQRVKFQQAMKAVLVLQHWFQKRLATKLQQDRAGLSARVASPLPQFDCEAERGFSQDCFILEANPEVDPTALSAVSNMIGSIVEAKPELEPTALTSVSEVDPTTLSAVSDMIGSLVEVEIPTLHQCCPDEVNPKALSAVSDMIGSIVEVELLTTHDRADATSEFHRYVSFKSSGKPKRPIPNNQEGTGAQYWPSMWMQNWFCFPENGGQICMTSHDDRHVFGQLSVHSSEMPLDEFSVAVSETASLEMYGA